ncbi:MULTISPECIES: hypothetical protein [Halobacterium]|uniref:hypothetical protein n=1 Tax=Halobacterium TaxID=2239 RepID=UPI001965836C|nr:hypothetical protein [Halobacterium sp. BOL4-2]QRY26364.1 hypothetical protein JRZ79_13015 [Halobacterium sp. BOL4-2]
MPVAEKTTGGEVYLRGIDRRVSAGDRVDVSEAFARYLIEERGDFRLVDDQDVDDAGAGDDTGSGFDLEEFLDKDAKEIVEDVEAGEADNHLDAVAGATEYVTVEDAIGERRATLEEA